MSIKNKIFRSNILIMGISLVFLLIVVIFSTNLFLKDNNNENDDKSVDSDAENIIYMFEHNISFYNDFNTLSKICQNGGYSLIVNSGGENIFSDSKDALERLRALNIPDNLNIMRNTIIYTLPQTTVIARNIDINGVMHSFYAISEPKEKTKGISFAEIIPFVVIVGFFTIFALLVLNRFLTKKLVDEIMIPINQLNYAAMRISINNLDVPVVYTGEEEFERVCKTFNKMQEAIKENRSKMIAYEQSRTDMVTGISHDLRTPLTSIKGYVKGILDGVADTPQKRIFVYNIFNSGRNECFIR